MLLELHITIMYTYLSIIFTITAIAKTDIYLILSQTKAEAIKIKIKIMTKRDPCLARAGRQCWLGNYMNIMSTV